MKAIITEISGVNVLIQATDDIIDIVNIPKPSGDFETDQEISGGEMGIGGIQHFGFSKKASTPEIPKNAFGKVYEVLSAFAKDYKEKFDKYDYAPNEVEVEYSLSLNGETNLWVIGAKAETGIKVRMKWEKNKPTQQQGGSI